MIWVLPGYDRDGLLGVKKARTFMSKSVKCPMYGACDVHLRARQALTNLHLGLLTGKRKFLILP